MANISTFELLAKRIGPPGGFGGLVPPTYTPFRKLLQGYYLTIANPTNRTVRLRMQTIIPKINDCSPFAEDERELSLGAIGVNYTVN